MSTKVENLFNLTNYRDHPEEKDYRVFFFYNLEQAAFFEAQLVNEGIRYESFKEEETDKTVVLFGIHKRDFRRALIQNDLSFAAHKKPFISNKLIRYSILFITIALVLFALIGYFISENKLAY
jgi:hypothetical protein